VTAYNQCVNVGMLLAFVRGSCAFFNVKVEGVFRVARTVESVMRERCSRRVRVAFCIRAYDDACYLDDIIAR